MDLKRKKIRRVRCRGKEEEYLMKEGDKKIFRIDYYYYITTTDRPQG